MDEKEISLMFSGGVDSTIAAINLSKQYAKVHLLTYCNGHGHCFMGTSGKRAKELNEKFGDKFVHNLIPIDSIFRKMVVEKLPQDYQEFQSGFIWCLGCKMTMHTCSIIYNLNHHIRFMADGSSADTSEMVEQSIMSISMIKMFYKQYAIDFFVPVYDQLRKEKIKELRKLKFKLGIPIGDRHLGIQPRCIPGELYYLPYLLFYKALEHEEMTVAAFIKKKQELAAGYIQEYTTHGKML